MNAKRIKRVGIYLRVSTLDQDTALQLRDLMEYVQARGWQVFRIYEDKITGTHANRKMLKELQADARQRKFDILLVWKLDRIFRSLKDCINGLQEFADLGVEFVSLKDTGIDMTTPSGKLLLHILAAFAEFEASIIRMRVKELDTLRLLGFVKNVEHVCFRTVARIFQSRVEMLNCWLNFNIVN